MFGLLPFKKGMQPGKKASENEENKKQKKEDPAREKFGRADGKTESQGQDPLYKKICMGVEAR